MIRQPASENRFTVACPIPREAPVSTMVFVAADAATATAPSPWKGHASNGSAVEPDMAGVVFGIDDLDGRWGTAETGGWRRTRDQDTIARSMPQRELKWIYGLYERGSMRGCGG